MFLDLEWFSLIGEDKTLSIKLGAEVGDASTEDIVMVRGIAEDVDRAVKEIEKMVLAAKNDEIDNSYVRMVRSYLAAASTDPAIAISLLSLRSDASSFLVLLERKARASTNSVTCWVSRLTSPTIMTTGIRRSRRKRRRHLVRRLRLR